MTPHYFTSPGQFRAWLHANHAREPELLVGYYKTGTGHSTISWSDSVDEALCYGWIDGVRRGVDAERYTIRFTPRRPRSIWSKVNMAKVERLIAEGRMQPAGLAAWALRTEERSGIYSFEQTQLSFDAGLERRFREHHAAWTFFQAQPPGYRRQMTGRVMSARQSATRERRLTALIEHSARGERMR